MKKGFNLGVLAFASILLSTAVVNAQAIQTLDTITGNGNTTNKSLFLYGNAKYNAMNRSGQSLYFLNDSSVIESGNPSTGVLVPLNIKSKVLSISNRAIINNAVDDGTSMLQVNGNLKLGSLANSGDITLTGRRGATLAGRLAEFGFCNMATVDGGDLHVVNYWGVAININKGIAGDNSLANSAVIPGTSSFTVNSYLNNTTLNTLFTVRNSGNVGIGITNPQTKLAVNGTISASRLIITQSGWADFVFADDYQLPSLKETEEYIKKHKHLPEVPSAAIVENDGQDVAEMNKILLQKVEELTLHLIEQEKRQQKMQVEIAALKRKIKTRK